MKTNTPSALRCALLVTAVSLCSTLSAETSSSTSGTTTGSTAAGSAHSGTTGASATVSGAERRSDMGASANLKRADREFFEKAAKSGLKEVAVSQMTMAKLTNPQVKQFAQMMVNDHSGANTELMALAQKKGVVLPPKDEVKVADKWSKKTDEVDEDYMEEMVSDHKESVELFERAAKSDDPEIAAFAAKTLPTLQHHLKMAQDLKKIVD